MHYEKKKLKDCCVFISDGDHLPPPKTQSGIPFITISNIDGYNKISFENAMYVPESYYAGLAENKKARKGDILYSVVGSFGKPVYIEEDTEFVFQRHIAILRPNACVDGRYLYYVMLSPQFYNMVDKLAIGCSQRTVTLDTLRNIEIEVPPIDKQRELVSLLVKIDEAIALNNKANRIAQSIMQTMFDYWFTQYDFPNFQGKPYRSSGGELVLNDCLNKEIPVGWKVVNLNELISIDTTSINPFEFPNKVFEHYSIPAFDENHYPKFEKGSSIESNKYVVSKEAILVSKLNPHFKRLWLPNCKTDKAICSTEFMAYVPMDLEDRPFLYGLIDSQEFYSHMVMKASSSTGSRKRIQPEVSLNYKICLPPKEIRVAFSAIYAPLMEKVRIAHVENYHLKMYRDWLLPLLMNGQATIE